MRAEQREKIALQQQREAEQKADEAEQREKIALQEKEAALLEVERLKALLAKQG